MFEELSKKIAFGLAKALFFVALAATAWFFLPDSLASSIGQSLNNAGDYVKNEALKRYPPISVRLAYEIDELKAESLKAVRGLQEKASTAVSSRIKQEFNNWIDALFKKNKN
jgi:hypothetical protein